MRHRTWFVSAALLVAIVLVVLVSTVPGVAAAIGRWFGYVPGVGLVREGQMRVLAEPVSVTREGITVTVDPVVINQERATLLYSVDGFSTTDTEPLCDYRVELRLPDGTPLLATPNGVQAWATGYQHRFDYPPLPAAVNEAKLVISCLFHAHPGAAPENWEIPLRFVPAPPDMTAFPVIEIPTATAAPVTPTASAAESTPTADTSANATSTTASAAAAPAALTLTLDRAVQMDDGYLLYATLHWEDTPFQAVDMTDPAALRLLDGSGQELTYELHSDEHTGINWDQRQTVIAIKTAPVRTTGPLTLTLEWVTVTLPAEASFVFDPGTNPQLGQEWQPDLELTIGEHRLRVRTITCDGSGYSVEMSSTTGIQNASVADREHPIASGFDGVSGSSGEEVIFFSGFNYAGGLPKGPVTLTVGSIGVKHVQRIEASWTP